MNKSFEKILERLDEYEYKDLIEHNSEQCEHCKRIDCEIGMDCTICVMDKAKEIVQEVAEEYNNGWIPCSERLPEKIGRYYIVSVKSAISELSYSRPALYDKDGFCTKIDEKVIAWQPLPESYQPKEE